MQSETRKLIKRQFYYRNENPYIHSIYSDKLNIAIHIRRPNKFDRQFYSSSSNETNKNIGLAGLDVPVDFYVNVIKQFLEL